jgi:hypothetical protein
MMERNFASLVLWWLMPFVCVLQFLGHGFLWLALVCIRKIFQLRYDTGFAALVLRERSHLQISLSAASFIAFRLKRCLVNLWTKVEAAKNALPPGRAQPHAQ